MGLLVTLSAHYGRTRMLTSFSAVGVVALGACQGTAPGPREPTPIPTAVTSAEAEYITNEPVPAASSASQRPAIAPVPTNLPDAAHLAVVQERVASCETRHCHRHDLLPAQVLVRTEDGPVAKLHGSVAADARPNLGASPPVAVWREVIGSGNQVFFPKVPQVTLFGVLLRGQGDLVLADASKPVAMTTWHAFRASGAGVSLRATGGVADMLVVAVHRDGAISTYLKQWKKQGRPSWTKRSKALSIVDLSHVSSLSWAGGAAHARLAFEKDKSPDAYLGLLSLSGDAPVPEHNHPTSWEVLFAIAGNGTLVFSGKGLANPSHAISFPIRSQVVSGSVLMVPPGVNHAWEPGHGANLRAVQLYISPGPEQRYRRLAGAPSAK